MLLSCGGDAAKKDKNGKFSKGSNDIIDKINWKTGLSENIKNDTVTTFVCVNMLLKPEPKALNEAKGLVTADYQTYLEAKWIEELRKKYKISVNRDILSKIK